MPTPLQTTRNLLALAAVLATASQPLLQPPTPTLAAARLAVPQASTVRHLFAARARRTATPATIRFLTPTSGLAQQPDVATLAIPGRAGDYLVPYIQTSPDLAFNLEVNGYSSGGVVSVTLDAGWPSAQFLALNNPPFSGTFHDLEMGDHTLSAELVGAPGRAGPSHQLLAATELTHVARGDIVAALGDSTTEGNGGPFFNFMPNWTVALATAAEWTSPDGRSYPQAGALSKPRSPASFTGTLGSLLEALWHHPVLVLNDGWSGATADDYSRITTSGELRAEYSAAHPDVWIVNLGVNDPLTNQSPAQFDVSMHAIVQNLDGLFGAHNNDIHVACPIYAKDARHNGEAQYLPVIEHLRATAGLGAAPNFFTYYQNDSAGVADEVHPNATGYHDMAILWAQALTGQNQPCV